MALGIPKVSYHSMLKEGARSYQGLEEAVFRNISACEQFSDILRTSFGPNAMKKIVINHLEKLFVTKDTATIVKELEVVHPAVKIIVMATKMAEQEVGDGINFIIQFAGALLSGAFELLSFGISPRDVVDGYDFALKKSVEILLSLSCSQITDLGDFDQIIKPIKTAVFSKQLLNADHLAKLICHACLNARSLNARDFDVDNVRSVKVLGSGVNSSEVYRGFILKGDVSGTISDIKNAKIAVFNTDFDLMNPETKGTVLLNTANELLSFSKGETDLLSKMVNQIKNTGCNVIVCFGKVADEALDCANRANIMVIKVTSKFDIQRLCRTTHASLLPLFYAPTVEQLGHCDHVFVKEVGDTNLIVFQQEREDSAVSTVIIRGSNENVLDDVDRAIDAGVNCFKSLHFSPVLLPGAGACEMELAVRLDKVASECLGVEKYMVQKFGEALKEIVRILAENNGMHANEILTKLFAEHVSGNSTMGLDIETSSSTIDASSVGIYDILHSKLRCLQLAVDAVKTILSVNQIIVARPAGGPVPRQNPNWDAD